MKKWIQGVGVLLLVMGVVGCSNGKETDKEANKEEMKVTIEKARNEVEIEWGDVHDYEEDDNYSVVGGGVVNATYLKTGDRKRVTMYGAELLVDKRYEEDYEDTLDVEDGFMEGHDNGIERYFVRVIEYENDQKVKDKKY